MSNSHETLKSVENMAVKLVDATSRNDTFSKGDSMSGDREDTVTEMELVMSLPAVLIILFNRLQNIATLLKGEHGEGIILQSIL